MHFLKAVINLVVLNFCCPALFAQGIAVKGDTLVVENTLVCHKYLINGGNMKLLSIAHKQEPLYLEMDKPAADLLIPGEAGTAQLVSLYVKNIAAAKYTNAYTEAIINFKINNLQVQRVLRLYEGSPAVQHVFYVKGKAAATQWDTPQNDALKMIEHTVDDVATARIGAVPFTTRGWKFTSVLFREATDYHDNPVTAYDFLPFSKKEKVQGNVLIAKNELQCQALFIIKEAPITFSQQYYPGYDFTVDYNGIGIHGLGIAPADLTENWIRGYGYALGLAANLESSITYSILSYQKQINKYAAQPDFAIMSNTWGDRSKDSRMNETFILAEIKAAAQMGITHVQLDDGWQQGLSENSASKAGRKWDDWQETDWQPHSGRFPNGFKNIIKEAQRNGIRLGLWFNPSKKDSYANWERDAKIVAGLYTAYGINVFKIDGMQLSDKNAENNLRSFFEKVKMETLGEVVFNLDVTAGNRMGYHYFTEFGNVFLENRYTDWGNYYPYRTLRNLWKLARYVPAQRLQCEFLNVYRNTGKYAATDVLSPHKAGMEYAMAATLFAQPLAWMELSSLPPNGISAVSRGSKALKDIFASIQDGVILPVGQEPDGYSYTGMLSIGNNKTHYLAVYREYTDSADYCFTLPLNIASVKVIAGSMDVDFKEASLCVKSAKPWDYAILKIESK